MLYRCIDTELRPLCNVCLLHTPWPPVGRMAATLEKKIMFHHVIQTKFSKKSNESYEIRTHASGDTRT